MLFRSIRLLTNHPRPLAALEGYGIEIVNYVRISEGQFTKADGWREGCPADEKLPLAVLGTSELPEPAAWQRGLGESPVN